MGEVDLRLAARRGLEADFERGRFAWAGVAEEVFHRGVAPGVAEIADLAQQATAGQLRVSGDALTQVALERRDLGRPG